MVHTSAGFIRALKLGILLLALGTVVPISQSAEITTESTLKDLLTLVRAFRTAYVKQVMDHLQRIGIEPKEHWADDDRAMMLPFQFVKRAGLQIKQDVGNLEIGLISLTPLYSSNFPRTANELEALKKLMTDPSIDMMTFSDGAEVKGLAADIAIHESCIQCHNHHENAVKSDFKLGDPMGAVIVRLKH